jgi:hypothetical protein
MTFCYSNSSGPRTEKSSPFKPQLQETSAQASNHFPTQKNHCNHTTIMPKNTQAWLQVSHQKSSKKFLKSAQQQFQINCLEKIMKIPYHSRFGDSTQKTVEWPAGIQGVSNL